MGNDVHGTALAVPFDSILTIPDNASITFKCIMKLYATSTWCYCYLKKKKFWQPKYGKMTIISELN